MNADYWRLKYGQQRARNAVFMQAVSKLARMGMGDFAKACVKAADEAALNVRPEDFVVARTNTSQDLEDQS